MRDAVVKSVSYAKELDNLVFVASRDEYIKNRVAILKKTAGNGIVQMKVLRKEFDINSEVVLKNKLQDKNNKTFFDKLLLKLSSTIHVTKINAAENSSNVEDIIARARAALNIGDNNLAINQIKTLTETDKKIYASWLDELQDYVSATAAAEEILRYSIRPNISNM